MIENNERLLVSCWDCRIIWFCDIDSGTFDETLKLEGGYPGPMCKAEGDYVFIRHSLVGSKDILKIKCSPTGLTVDKGKTIHYNLDKLFSTCYLPDVKGIGISSWENNIVEMIHCEMGDEIWEVKGDVASFTWKPCGLLYSPQHQSLLVCDASDNGRLVVLKPP